MPSWDIYKCPRSHVQIKSLQNKSIKLRPWQESLRPMLFHLLPILPNIMVGNSCQLGSQFVRGFAGLARCNLSQFPVIGRQYFSHSRLETCGGRLLLQTPPFLPKLHPPSPQHWSHQPIRTEHPSCSCSSLLEGYILGQAFWYPPALPTMMFDLIFWPLIGLWWEGKKIQLKKSISCWCCSSWLSARSGKKFYSRSLWRWDFWPRQDKS